MSYSRFVAALRCRGFWLGFRSVFRPSWSDFFEERDDRWRSLIAEESDGRWLWSRSLSAEESLEVDARRVYADMNTAYRRLSGAIDDDRDQ